MLNEKKKGTEKERFNFLNLTKFFLKDQIIYYILATIVCVLGQLVSNNQFKIFSSAMRTNKVALTLYFNFGFFELKQINFFSKTKFFFSLLILLSIYCIFVLFHIYMGFRLPEKISVFLRKKTFEKNFSLKEGKDAEESKKKIPAILASHIPIFSKQVFFVPNQLYYSGLEILLSFLIALRELRKVTTASFGEKFKVAIFGVLSVVIFFFLSFILQKIVFKKDTKVKEKTNVLSQNEVFLIEKRELILKKSLIENYKKKYWKALKESSALEETRTELQSLSMTIPSFFLTKALNISLIFIVENNALMDAAKKISESILSLKVNGERLKEYPLCFAAKREINAFFSLKDRNDIQENVLILEPAKEIKIINLSFSYEDETKVFENFSTTFKFGEVNRLSGKNGFGKSTLIKIILGLLNFEKGDIVINGKYSLKTLNLKEWRKKISYSEQQNLVSENLSLGQKQVLDLEETIQNSENKEILIFDEAGSSLDKQKKEEFHEQIKRESFKKIVILIEH